jgi:hypothetical protein
VSRPAYLQTGRADEIFLNGYKKKHTSHAESKRPHLSRAVRSMGALGLVFPAVSAQNAWLGRGPADPRD